ncbi:16S rRNA (guanine(527)-N(7))-methyltransferase RsmG [Sporolactobacillus sp. THM7-7]|nr:16S rRNA (guanine(527)-N(7))-methyltransferase RsmG [Sporolactobacillus sp. THM7-7]
MKRLDALLSERGIYLSAAQKQQFNTYYRLLVEWNKKMNLTAITDEEEVALKHFYDSMTPAFYYSFTHPLKLCDVGSGAGFPGIPLKILYPNIELTIVDSLKKRLTFLDALTAHLSLQDVRLFHERAESFGRRPGMREAFDVVTARAVAHLSVLSEYCLPLVRKNGLFIALKGAHAEEELQQAEQAIHLLGGGLKRSESFDLPEKGGKRMIIFIEKKDKTPKKYPRKPGVPAKDPL